MEKVSRKVGVNMKKLFVTAFVCMMTMFFFWSPVNACEFPCFEKSYESTSKSTRNTKGRNKTVNVSRNYESGSNTGIASFYWQPQAVACGGRFNPSALTAAHRSYPCGSRVLVRNLRNGSTVTVTINDRGPFVAGRIIDLSKAAAQQIGMVGSGLTQVSIQRL